MMDIALAAIMGPLDRLRGSAVLPSKLSTLIYGLALAAMLTATPWQIVALALAFVLGEAPGWGNALGHALNGKPTEGREYEWWQVGVLKTSPWTSLFVRGYLWGLPMAMVGMFISIPVALAMPFILCLAMPLAAAVVRAYIGWKPAKHLWAAQEWVRGWLVGLMTLGVAWNF